MYVLLCLPRSNRFLSRTGTFLLEFRDWFDVGVTFAKLSLNFTVHQVMNVNTPATIFDSNFCGVVFGGGENAISHVPLLRSVINVLVIDGKRPDPSIFI